MYIHLQSIIWKQNVTSLASPIQAGLQVAIATFEQSDLAEAHTEESIELPRESEVQ